MRFGFIVHPLSPAQRMLLGIRSADVRLVLSGTSNRSPARAVAELRLADALGNEVWGILAAVPQLPHELLEDQEAGVAAILEAVRRCSEAGAQVVGLGAVAAVIGGQGKAVARAAPCPITTGNGYTALAAVRTLSLFRDGGGRAGPVGLTGPPGAVAMAIGRALVAQGCTVRVVSADPPLPLRRQVDAWTAIGPGRASLVPSADEVLREGQVLVAASSTGGHLRLSTLPPGTVVIDVAEPRDVLDDIPPREDVLVLDGEYVRLPSPLRGTQPWSWLYGLVTGQRQSIFACFAEPMLLALTERTDLVSQGRDVQVDLEALASLSAAHGFRPGGLFERGQTVRPARLAAFGA